MHAQKKIIFPLFCLLAGQNLHLAKISVDLIDFIDFDNAMLIMRADIIILR